MVTIVLLNVDWMWAIPSGTFFFSRFFAVFLLGLAMDPPGHQITWLLFLPGNRPAGPLARSGIRVRALAAAGQTLAVPQAPVGPDVHEPLDRHGDVPAEIPLHLVLLVDDVADSRHFRIGDLVRLRLVGNARFAED